MDDSQKTAGRFAADLRRCGIREGGVLLVHSSLSALGYVPGGPEAVIQGLLASIGPEGTLLLPALSYETVNARQPLFDVRATASCIGAIPEHFRTRAGTLRSLHPTHSVAGVGRLAAEIVGDHHHDRTPVGEHSPFRKVRDLGGQLVFLGCGLRPNTSMHGVEEVAEAPYLFGDDVTYHMLRTDGTSFPMTCRRHASDGWRQRYDRIEPLLTPGEEMRRGQVLQATTFVLEATALWDRGVDAIRSDPHYFVERVAP